MPEETYERVKRVYDKDYEERKRWEQLWTECSELAQPEYMDMEDNWDPNNLIGDNVFDGSARIAAQIASSGMFGYATNPADEWVSVGISNRQLKENGAVRDWIADTNHVLMEAFEKYDLYEQLVPAFNSIMVIGTASITVDEEPATGGIRYRFWHPGDYTIGTDAYNDVNRFGTNITYENHKLLQLFTPEQLGRDLYRMAKESPFSETDICFQIMPNELYEPGNPFSNRFMYSGYYLNPRDQNIMKVEGFNRLPVAVWRWTTQGRLTYGFSPTAKALPDIYVMNQSARSRIEAEQKMADPPLNIPKEMRDDYHLGPGGRNFYRSPDRRVYDTGVRYDYPAAIDSVNRYQQLVNQHFFTDFFVLLAQSTTRRTTAEVAEIMQEKAAMLGPIVSFMNHSFLEPLARQTLRILGKQGKLPVPPQEIMNEELEITFKGPLAVAQKYAQLQKRVINPLNQVMMYAQVDPTVMDNFSLDATARYLAAEFGLPYGVMRSEGDVEMIRYQRQQAMAQQAQAEQANQIALETIKHGQDAIEPGSLLAEGEEQAAGL